MIDVVIIAGTKNKDIETMTQNAIDSCGCNVYVVETFDKKVKYKGCKTVYYIKKKFNYNKAVNFGISKTKSQYIGFFNNDVVFEKGWDKEIIKQMKKHGALSASPTCRKSHVKTKKEVIQGYEVRRQVAGWAIVVDRNIFYKIGKINTDVDFWLSDNVYVEQIKQADVKHILVTNSKVLHLDGGSKTLDISTNKRELTQGQYKKKVKIDFKYKFSIVMPSFCGMYGTCAPDRENLLRRALKSILTQTYKDYEIILVSDGCDKTVDIYRELVSDENKDYFKCLKIPKQEIFSGQVRQSGIINAVGEWVIYLDSDDYWGENHLKNIESQLIDIDWAYMDENLWNGKEWRRKDVILQMGRAGTSSIVHKRLLKASWTGKNGYAHDFRFIEDLMKYPNYKKIKKGEYYIMHLA